MVFTIHHLFYSVHHIAFTWSENYELHRVYDVYYISCASYDVLYATSIYDIRRTARYTLYYFVLYYTVLYYSLLTEAWQIVSAL